MCKKKTHSPNEFIVGLFIALMSFFLILVKSPHSSLGDNGIYIAAGGRLVSGAKIYENGFRGGPLGALFLFLIDQLFSPKFSWFVFQLASVVVMLFMSALLSRGMPILIRLTIGLFAISSAPVRELLHNHQITVLVIGLTMWPFYFKLSNLAFKIGAIASLGIALDLKPQVALFLFVGLAICTRKLYLIPYTFLFSISSHLLISIYRQENVDAQWISLLFHLYKANQWGESIFLWPVLEHIGFPVFFLLILEYGTILIVAAGVLKFALLRNIEKSLIFISLLTYFFNYSHFYDCILIATLAIVSAFKKTGTLPLMFMMFAIIPGEFFNTLNFLFGLVMITIYILTMRASEDWEWKSAIFAVLSLPLLHLFLNSISNTFDMELRIRSFIYVLLACSTIFDVNSFLKR